MPTNTAVWLTAKRAGFEIGPAPYTPPRADEIVLKNRAVAINPIDWLMQPIGDIAFPWIKYPFILGSDAAGDVVEVGTAVTRFKVGDRVFGHAVGIAKSRASSAEGAFQDYPILLEHMAAPIPDTMAYENAAVLPLGVSTAASGLFQQDFLALHHPSANPASAGKTLLVWGGSTSVGSNAIQLAVAGGYDVITTASRKNFGYVEKLGASRAFDYASATVVGDIVKALAGKSIAGALAIGPGSGKACLDVVRACEGDRFVAMTTPPVAFDEAPLGRLRIPWLVPKIGRMVAANVSMALNARTGKIRTKFIFGASLMDNEVGRMIYADFLPRALANGSFVAAPDPLVVGHGIGAILKGLEVQKKGVSATKVVVSL